MKTNEEIQQGEEPTRKTTRQQANERKLATPPVLVVVDDHPNPLQKLANNPVATRTVFTTQIWDVYWNNSTTAQDGRPRISSEHETALIKRMQRSPKMAEKTAQNIGSPLRKETQQLPETAEKQLRTRVGCWEEK